VQTGKELRRLVHTKTSYGIPSLAFSPDAKLLATRSHDGRMRLFDVDTGKERKTFPPDGGGRRLGTVAFSPDGKIVAAAGDAIRLYDVATGTERLCIERKQATGLVFTDGGKTLTGAVMGTIYRWDIATGKAVTPEGGDSIVEQVLVTADGSRVVTRGQDGDAHLWDGHSGKHLRAIRAAWAHGLAMSPDGRFLVWPVSDESVKFEVPDEPNTIYNGSRLRWYDVAADKVVDRFPAFKGDAQDLIFIDGGKRLVTVDHRDGMLRIWDVAAAREERSLQAMPAAQKKQPTLIWRVALSHDGKTLAAGYDAARGGGGVRNLGFRGGPHLVRLWDMASGKELHTLDAHRSYVLDMAFSPDGRLLATAGERSAVFVWDTASGKRVASLPNGLPVGANGVAFSRDGRLLAAALPEGAIQIWEVATWTKRNEYKGHGERATVLTFAPNGQLLSGSVDTTVLAWNTRPPRLAPSVSLESAWNDLAAREASTSFQSEGRFLAAPAEAIKWFAKKIALPEALDPKQARRWLADLGSDVFETREAASQALQRLDRQALPYLQEALKSAESLEVRRRVEKILEQQRVGLTPDQIRQVRAVMVLERIGDGAAQELLRRWADGPAGALLTMEASAALNRLQTAPTADR
jgi:WD40 repeat protein